VADEAAADEIRKLFEREVPEIRARSVEIVAIARERGRRTKVAVRSLHPDVDPVMACCGLANERIGAIVRALGSERIDLVPWDENPVRYVCAALAGVAVKKVRIQEEERWMQLTVETPARESLGDHLALAQELTGWQLVAVDPKRA